MASKYAYLSLNDFDVLAHALHVLWDFTCRRVYPMSHAIRLRLKLLDKGVPNRLEVWWRKLGREG